MESKTQERMEKVVRKGERRWGNDREGRGRLWFPFEVVCWCSCDTVGESLVLLVRLMINDGVGDSH